MLLTGLKLGTALFWVITQRVVVVPYGRFWDKLSAPSSRVKNPKSNHNHYSLRNNPEEGSFRLLRVESLKSRLGLRFSQWWFCRLKSSCLLHVDWYITDGRNFVVPFIFSTKQSKDSLLRRAAEFSTAVIL
jgi:hypothetical protein